MTVSVIVLNSILHCTDLTGGIFRR